MDQWIKDILFAFRSLLRRPGFTAAALVSLALGIGASSTVFKLIDAAFLRSLLVSDPQGIVILSVTDAAGTSGLPVSFPNYEDLSRRNQSLSGLAAFQWLHANLLQGDEPKKIFIQVATEGYFDLLGIPPALGRTFTAQDFMTPSPVAVLTHSFWQSELGGDPQVLGRTVHLNGQIFTVVGVMPRGFKGTRTFSHPELWLPMSMYRQISPYHEFFENRGAQMFEMVGRLKPDVSVEQAAGELAAVATNLEQEHPDVNRGEGLAVEPLSLAAVETRHRAVYRRSGLLLVVVAGLLLLIASGNVASLLLARGLEQRREIGVRLSLGARRGHLVRQLVLQSLVLSLLGGALGLLLALQGPAFLWRFRPPDYFTETALDLGADVRVVLFTFGLSALAGLVFGLAPALQSTRPDLVPVLSGEVPALGGRPRALPLRDLFILAQVTLCFLSLTGAGLFLKSLSNARQMDPGFDVDKLLVITYNLNGQVSTPAQGQAFHRRMLETLASQPGVEAVSLASNQPLGGGPALYSEVVDEASAGSGPLEDVLVRTNAVSPGYFDAVGIPLRRGRGFSDQDRAGAPFVTVVNETMARQLWPGQDPVGRRFRAPDLNQVLEVVGVAADSKYITLGEDPQPSFYLPLLQWYRPEVTLHVRTRPSPEAMLESVRQTVRSLDRTLTLSNVFTMRQAFDTSLWAQRMGAVLLSLFGILGLLLASTGIYGVLSYSVHQRMKEMGIRIALGAGKADVMRLVVQRAMVVALFGLALGLAGAAAGARLLSSLLYGIHPTDPATLFQIAGLLAGVALVASCTAARRATRADPARVMNPG